MFFAKSRPLGLRTRLVLWTSVVPGASLAAGFAWVHHGLRAVLEARNDAFLQRKAAELLAGVADHHLGCTSVLESEIQREVSAYEAEGLICVVRDNSHVSVAPNTDVASRLAERLVPFGDPQTFNLIGTRTPFRCSMSARESRAFAATGDLARGDRGHAR